MSLSKERHTKISKSLSYWLRHKPEDIDIVLDKDGWTSVVELIEKAKSKVYFDFNELKEVVKNCDKQRFSLSEDFTMIRANQGHTTEVEIKFKKVVPPVILYHGTVKEFIDSIKKKGLIPGKRHHVHLSKDRETAEKVGSRRGKPIILEVDCKKMLEDGCEFFISDNGVYLVDIVEPKYIKNL
jgi:putative RNA 2'-phosphotransferase